MSEKPEAPKPPGFGEHPMDALNKELLASQEARTSLQRELLRVKTKLASADRLVRAQATLLEKKEELLLEDTKLELSLRTHIDQARREYEAQ